MGLLYLIVWKICMNLPINLTSYIALGIKNGSSDDDTIITFIGNKIFTLLGKILFGVKVSDILYSYILFRRSEFLNLKLKSKILI